MNFALEDRIFKSIDSELQRQSDRRFSVDSSQILHPITNPNGKKCHDDLIVLGSEDSLEINISIKDSNHPEQKARKIKAVARPKEPEKLLYVKAPETLDELTEEESSFWLKDDRYKKTEGFSKEDFAQFSRISPDGARTVLIFALYSEIASMKSEIVKQATKNL